MARRAVNQSEGSQAPFLTVKGVATYFGCSVATVYRMLEDGEFPEAIRLRGAYRIRRDSVESYIAEHMIGSLLRRSCCEGRKLRRVVKVDS